MQDGGAGRDDEADVLDLTAGVGIAADVPRPAPARLVGRAPDDHPADAHELEAAARSNSRTSSGDSNARRSMRVAWGWVGGHPR
mgnify:CR=1 FL=1